VDGLPGQGKFSLQSYEPPGPVGAAFIQSTGPIDIIGGPAGSGKTVASSFKGPYLAGQWAPVCKDGVIRVKQATIRTTYRDLARTCLSSWHEMFPENHPFTAEYKGGLDRPVTRKLEWAVIRDGRRVKVEYIHEFGAIGDANIEQFIKGYEITFGWMNECDLLDERVPGLFLSRTRLISEFVAERTNRLVSWTMKKPTARARLLGHASPAAIAASGAGA